MQYLIAIRFKQNDSKSLENTFPDLLMWTSSHRYWALYLSLLHRQNRNIANTKTEIVILSSVKRDDCISSWLVEVPPVYDSCVDEGGSIFLPTNGRVSQVYDYGEQRVAFISLRRVIIIALQIYGLLLERTYQQSACHFSYYLMHYW